MPHILHSGCDKLSIHLIKESPIPLWVKDATFKMFYIFHRVGKNQDFLGIDILIIYTFKYLLILQVVFASQILTWSSQFTSPLCPTAMIFLTFLTDIIIFILFQETGKCPKCQSNIQKRELRQKYFLPLNQGQE